MDSEEMELATIERLLKERDSKLELIDLLEKGQTEKVINLLKRDVNTINESMNKKKKLDNHLRCKVLLNY